MQNDERLLRMEIDRLRTALRVIADWNEFPDTGKTWPSGKSVSYYAAYGSNGEREYMRGIAKKALGIS